jgi:hypothetical protein
MRMSNDPLELPPDLWFCPTFMVELVPGKLDADGHSWPSLNDPLELPLDLRSCPTFMVELVPGKLAVLPQV